MHKPLLFLVLALFGCPRRIDFGPKGEVKDAPELLKLVQAAEDQVVSVKGEAKIRVDGPEHKGVVTLFVAVHHPSLIHLESLDFFGKPQAVLVSDGTSFALFSVQEGKFFKGPATARNVSRFLPLALPPRELTALLLGKAPRIPHQNAELSVDLEAAAYRLELSRDAVTQSLWVHPSSHRVLRSQLRGASSYEVRFDELDSIDGATYPRKVSLNVASANTQVDLMYKDVGVNEAVDLTLFELAAPPNVPIVEVDERGEPRGVEGGP